MKVILVLPYSSLVTDNFQFDIFGDGYHVRTAKEIWKRSDKYQLECWRPERTLKQEIVGEKDGIVYRAFPSWRPSLGVLTDFVYKKVVDIYAPLRWALWKEYSLPLLRSLRKECTKGDVLLYLFHVPFDLTYLICLFCKGIPIVGQHIGGNPYGYGWRSYLANLPLSLLEQRALSNIDVMMMGTEWHYSSFKKAYRKIPKFVYPMPQSIDFDFFKTMDKKEARDLVGIDQNKKVIIHVGRFDYAKGFDTILEILPLLREKYDIEVIAIGGTREDMLYQRAIDSGVRVIQWLSPEKLRDFYNASDVYLFPKFYENENEADSERFMGAGVAPVEALACGIPVIGTNLKTYYATPEEMVVSGEIPHDKDDLMVCIDKVFTHPEVYSGCREVAMKYYSWSPRIDSISKAFAEMEVMYYGKDKSGSLTLLS